MVTFVILIFVLQGYEPSSTVCVRTSFVCFREVCNSSPIYVMCNMLCNVLYTVILVVFSFNL